MEAVSKVIKAKPEGETKSGELDLQNLLDSDKHNKSHTTHFKMITTQITEIDKTESDDDSTVKNVEASKETEKTRGCWGRCFKKKGA